MRSSSSPAGFDIREAVENLRDAFTPRGSGRSAGASHGDLRAAILSALQHEAKNGHQVMQAIGAASGGMWMPSASQVYPMLQQLTDEGLLSVQHDGERSVYALTESGREAAAAHTHEPAGESSSRSSWNVSDITDRMSEAADRMSGRMNDHWNERTSAVPRAGAKLAQAAAQVTQSGTREQQERAAALLDQTRKALYAILAED
ncbi:MAG: PadR family transcriptional regulator [Microbacterium sp.]|nr:PadR family transcriptional regulator [Microbacterium sp.]MBA4346147.1 PadR family transcriptional regulator [Microbacterium sp.]